MARPAKTVTRKSETDPATVAKRPARARPKLMKQADIGPFLTAIAGGNPNPRTELDYGTPYQLLVAVVLSAQATDVGVNRATKKLFAKAPGAAEIVALGEAGLGEYIKTIGLWKAKAKNVIALSQLLLDRHGGEVPGDREALEALPGVGRKTANVVLNEVFGQPPWRWTRISSASATAPAWRRATPRAVEDKLLKRIPEAMLKPAHSG